jgi:hypothetical protein
MPHNAADRRRNVALIGHRGSGKTSLHEALLFEAGIVNRLGSVEDGTTTSDYEPDEQAREMSIGATVSSFEHDGRKINLRAVGEGIGRAGSDPPLVFEDAEVDVPADSPQSEHGQRLEDFQFALQIGPAMQKFAGQRFIARRRATCRRRDVGVP